MYRYSENKLDTFQERYKDRARLLIKCPDKQGIVAAVSTFLHEQGANIVASNQYTVDPEGGEFFMRLEFEIKGLSEQVEQLKEKFQFVAERMEMEWRIAMMSEFKNVAIFVSKEPHCLLELLWEWQSGDLLANIKVVISNHETAREMVEAAGIPFYHVPVTKGQKKEAEDKQNEILKKYDIEMIILARYMQILSPHFVEKYENKIINIHHSFLPAFIGAKPYERAYDRGVKMIGATSHYVTNDLDEGPIIEQDIDRVNHEQNAADLKKIGQSIERRVLSRAVKWHLEDRILVHENKTIIFE
ncbi:formyltetrahydrofolate deformylase [Oceanobacillus kimchii]|uniref:formyltetrahydrofolate deformylase n=1 Tax=Oceanobacillus TaxID=182709 RepID=UPI000349D9FA|nr:MULTISPECIES: formyltetrahydrofolate deformylase [Oceanobacillus]MCT1578200.1 formyltetrahydrofolate deformylase [Oceanobacillus kimchii]MCT2134378.1 formyltetrahydrofolate deformylase [Oceanobacillus kimchii]OEH54994.1 formyltetrahydrofolate deformylase [Oceanobacillus sp. E9]